jgi:two-component system sensor histidine kinase RpfC
LSWQGVMSATLLGSARKLQARAPGDVEMVVNRAIAGALILIFNVIMWRDPRQDPSPLIASTLYLAGGLAIAVHLMMSSAAPELRRACALCLDMAAMAFELHHGGRATCWLYPTYLWIIFGNGFRFGPSLLLLAAALGALSFGGVIAFTPFWRAQPTLSVGLLVGLMILPLYALRLIRKLSQARHQAEQASRAKSLFLASVSHDLRTPLNTILGMGALLGRSRLDTEQRDMSQTMMLAARTLLGSIDGILDLSRIESGKMPEVRVEFDLAEFLTQLRRMVLPQATAKSLYLGLHVAAGAPLRLNGDDRRLREILLNLVANAIKFTKTGGIIITVEPILIGASTARLRFEVTDTGIGIPLEARQRIFETFVQADDTILDQFGGTGLGLSITRQSVQLLGGTLGLDSTVGVGSTFWFELDFGYQHPPIAARAQFAGMKAVLLAQDPRLIAALLGRLNEWGVQVDRLDAHAQRRAGIVQLDGPQPDGILALVGLDQNDALPQGASLPTDTPLIALYERLPPSRPDAELRRSFITLLAADPSDENIATALGLARSRLAVRAEISADQAPLPTAKRGLRILAVDDNLTNRKVLGKILESAGHMVTLAEDGDTALDLLTEQDFDVAILDVNMPGMNGVDLVRNYRMLALGEARMPIIGLTADSTPQTRTRCLEAGMDACLTKPIEPGVLIATIDAAVEGSGEAASQSAISDRLASVAQIKAHPRFRPASAPAVDPQTITGLLELAGPEFLAEVIKDYVVETRVCLKRIQAAASGDVPAFRSHIHALRSSAANIGALELSRLCRPWEITSAEALVSGGSAFLARLEAEIDRVEIALRQHEAEAKASARK